MKMKENLKTKWLNIRVTEAEKKVIDEKAALSSLPVSRLILESLKRVKTWTIKDKAIESKKIREIIRVGNNLNQIAKWCQTYKETADNIAVLNQLLIIEQQLNLLIYPPKKNIKNETE